MLPLTSLPWIREAECTNLVYRMSDSNHVNDSLNKGELSMIFFDRESMEDDIISSKVLQTTYLWNLSVWAAVRNCLGSSCCA
jgi:hypothetical protein